jgi:hypothetical protein
MVVGNRPLPAGENAGPIADIQPESFSRAAVGLRMPMVRVCWRSDRGLRYCRLCPKMYDLLEKDIPAMISNGLALPRSLTKSFGVEVPRAAAAANRSGY